MLTPEYRLLALACRMSLPGARRLVGDDRVDVRVEEHRLQAREHRVERLALPRSANVAPVLRRRLRRARQTPPA